MIAKAPCMDRMGGFANMCGNKDSVLRVWVGVSGRGRLRWLRIWGLPNDQRESYDKRGSYDKAYKCI